MVSEWIKKAHDMLALYLNKYKDPDIPSEWVVGLISVECSRLDPAASRFEEGVWKSIMKVKGGGKSTAFPGFNSGKIHDFIMSTNNLTHLRSLATSYGLGQIMGYHYLNKWGLKPEEYMKLNLETSVKYTIAFMKDGYEFALVKEKEGKRDQGKTFERLLRIHNTGSATGKTYDPDYVSNATATANQYVSYVQSLEKKKK